MEDRDWLIIKVLQEQKNITKTAQTLFISQPNLTTRIRHIEEEFGVKMIYRGSRGVHFTPEGDYLAQCAQNMLLNIRQIKEQVVNMGNEVKGTLCIGASNYLSKYKIPRLLGLFKETYPQVEFKEITSFSKDVCGLLYNQDVHVGFVRSDFGWHGEKHVLYEEPVCVAAKEALTLADLPGKPRIDYHTDDSFKNLIDTWWSETFLQPPTVGMTVGYIDVCRSMVANGLGYAIVPYSLLDGVEPMHRIILQEKNGQPLLRKTWMLYHKEMLELKLVRLFLEFAESVDYAKLI